MKISIFPLYSKVRHMYLPLSYVNRCFEVQLIFVSLCQTAKSNNFKVIDNCDLKKIGEKSTSPISVIFFCIKGVSQDPESNSHVHLGTNVKLTALLTPELLEMPHIHTLGLFSRFPEALIRYL